MVVPSGVPFGGPNVTWIQRCGLWILNVDPDSEPISHNCCEKDSTLAQILKELIIVYFAHVCMCRCF